MVRDNVSAMLPTATFVLLLCRYTMAFVALAVIAVSKGRFLSGRGRDGAVR